MGKFLVGFLLPLLLLTAALINWSLISLFNLLAFLLIQFKVHNRGYNFGRRVLFLWTIVVFILLAILSEAVYLIVWTTEGSQWSIADAWWAKLIGLSIIRSWKSPAICMLLLQPLAVFVALLDIYGKRFGLAALQDSWWSHALTIVERLGSHLRIASCLILPGIQLVVGISNPSWVSLPFFIGSCVGLVDWSLTSNFLGLFRWWKPLQLYAAFNVVLLYVYQIPINFPSMFQWIADFIGLFKITSTSEWAELCSVLSLILFYIMVSYVKCDLEEMDFMMSMRESNLTERLLPLKHSFFVRESRSGVRHTNVLLRRPVFRTFSINFFTYGFPVSLLALLTWSFHFASICAFGLLIYIGYIVSAFPSLFRLHRLNGLLLVFILLWAVSTYVFNVAFAFLDLKLEKEMEIWEMVGLWHYPIPGFFLLAQFCLGILVALGNLVNNSVFLYLSEEGGKSSNQNSTVEVEEETKVLIVATIAWGLRKCSRAITLALIFFIAMKPGFIHAIYMIFFLIFLLGHQISRKIRHSLILLCEAHFAVLYILKIGLISNALERKGSFSKEILLQLGLLEHDSASDFLGIALLGCFCAIHNSGFEMLVSFSAVVQHTPSPPVGFSILKAGLNKSVLLSVYASPAIKYNHHSASYERIASFLGAVGQKFLSVYRSCGTFIAFMTILLTVYLVTPNYTSFGYFFLLLVWITGRQLAERTKRRLWFPLKAYAVVVLTFIYILSSFPSSQIWLSRFIDLHFYLGYNSKASLLENVWESLAILVVMQLFSYERRQSRYTTLEELDPLDSGVVGFLKRFLIWHSQKILLIAVFYAALSPISAFGFIYLLGLVFCSALPKSSKIPSKSFLVYTTFLVTTEYLYQMWGKQAGMFPGRSHFDLTLFLGFRVYEAGFWGLETGLRGKVLVIAACTLQYNVFHWIEKMQSSTSNDGNCEEPCPLFVSAGDDFTDNFVSNGEDKPLLGPTVKSVKQETLKDNSWPLFSSGLAQEPCPISPISKASEDSSPRKVSFDYSWGSTKETQKRNKKHMVELKKERFDMQKTLLEVHLKFWIENIFNLFGLEINMIALLVASFALLNAISLLYIALLAACIILDRRILRKLWPLYVFLFAAILILEYSATWKNMFSTNHHIPKEDNTYCHDCWRISALYFNYCKNCWLGLTVDDSRVLISYFMVFWFASFKLRADHSSNFSWSSTYHHMMSQRKYTSVWRDLSFETKNMWTFLDYMRLYCYCHLLDLVLALILLTGTLEYDILHFGYLAFALVFFRLRLEILKERNTIFKYLRMYNFVLIILSLAYQSPFVGEFNFGKRETIDYIYEVIGFYKYDYGFRITARSALVEIIIFMLVALQSYMFSSQEFDYVARYLEAEQIGAIVNEQEKRARWKNAQLQQIRKSEEEKHQRNLQVEKMKSEMLNLQIQLHDVNPTLDCGKASPRREGLKRRRRNLSQYNDDEMILENESVIPKKQEQLLRDDLRDPSEVYGHYFSTHIENPAASESPNYIMECKTAEISQELSNNAYHTPEKKETDKVKANLTLSGVEFPKYLMNNEITETKQDMVHSAHTDGVKKQIIRFKENALVSAVHLIGDGVSQVQALGNQAVNNLVSFLNTYKDDSYMSEYSSSDDEVYEEVKSQRIVDNLYLHRSSSLKSDRSTDATSMQIGRIFCHLWSQMRANNDVVCYCCFILVFLWNFSLLSMVYLTALFVYALCVNTGPSYGFWVVMLIYTELYILLLYLYQVLIQHCGFSVNSDLLHKFGFPPHKITVSFVVSSLPIFIVYLFTLLQASITAKDGDWMPSVDFSMRRSPLNKDVMFVGYSWSKRARELVNLIPDMIKLIFRRFIRYWNSLTQGAESPPYFVQVSMDVNMWPEDGIQPERIESAVNQLLKIIHDERCKEKNPYLCPFASMVHVQSIERSQENPNVGLVVFEVVYACPLSGCTTAVWCMSLTPAANVAEEIRRALRVGLIEEVGFPYPILSVIGGGKREVDLYAYIFGADLTVLFLVAFFYQSIIKNNSEFLDVYQLEDQFPKEFVFNLMVIFFLIVLDRIIYLCSFATGKVIFYLFNLILFTYSVTDYAWSLEPSHQHAARFALRAIFLAKAVSLSLQAIQIRHGVPHKSTLYRQFLTSKVSQVNFLGYRLYRALPFLYELRCVLDWSCTTTSLTMYDWLKLEDINASLYLVKCDAVLNRAMHKQGEKQTKLTKCCSGICLLFILICVIWAPMLMYSSGNPTNIANPIKDASVQIDIKTVGGRLTLYQTTLCEKLQWNTVQSDIDLDPQGYLDTYNKNDIQLICCQADASSLWLVPDIVQTRFIQSLDQVNDMQILFTWVLHRDRPKGKEVVRYERPIDTRDLPTQADVQKALNGSSDRFTTYNLYPKYFRVTGSADVRPFEEEVYLVSADLVINRKDFEWWSFHDINSSNVSGCEGSSGPMAIIVSEETPPQGILGDTISKFSIWGLYISFVLAVGRFIRLQCSDLRMRIPYENLPSCDRLIAICEDIYAARAEGELGVEAVLYWTLIKIYRSPHMLLEYTTT